MKRDDGVNWRKLGYIEKTFFLLVALWAVLYFAGVAARYQTMIAIAAIVMGILTIVKIGRMALRNAIWRLRNRLIVAYLFIAVVPIVLILALMLGTSYAVVGQVAVFLVNRQLENHMRTLHLPAEAMTRAPARDPQTAIESLAPRHSPQLSRPSKCWSRASSSSATRRLPRSTSPPEPWKNTSGLITKKDADGDRTSVRLGAFGAGQ